MVSTRSYYRSSEGIEVASSPKQVQGSDCLGKSCSWQYCRYQALVVPIKDIAGDVIVVSLADDGGAHPQASSLMDVGERES